MTWYVQADVALPRHPRLLRLARAMEITPAHAVGLLVTMWAAFREHGDPRSFAAEDLDRLLEVGLDRRSTGGRPSVDLQLSGWITVNERGRIESVRGWERYETADKRREAERKRSERRRKKEQKKPPVDRRSSRGRPAGDLRPEAEADLEDSSLRSSSSFARSRPADSAPVSVDIALDGFPLAGKAGEWALTTEHMSELSEAFPGVDVLAEALKARQWLRDQPSRRKTLRGMRRFLSGWMERQQNRAPATPSPARRDTVADRLWARAEGRARQKARESILTGSESEVGGCTWQVEIGDESCHGTSVERPAMVELAVVPGGRGSTW